MRGRTLKTIPLLLSMFMAWTGDVYAQITLKSSNQTVQQIMKNIEKQSKYKFFYNSNFNVLSEKKNLSVNDASIESTLTKLFANTGVAWEIKDNVIVLTPAGNKSAVKSDSPKGATKKIKGVVTDGTGEPVIGANVVVQGTTTGTITDFDGNFVLDVPNNSVLKVSYIGMTDMLVQTKGKDYLNVKMADDSKALDEIVVVGYTLQSKNEITGSVATLKSEKLKDVSSANVSSMLQGKMAGVQVLNSTGKPGSTANITIRGKGSISSSLDPIWVVDGVIFNSDPRLSPNEIESLSILKDASATALYGSRASNGVIVVTTKSGGKKVGETTISLTANAGINNLSLGKLDLMDSQELYDYQKGFNNQSWFSDNLLTHNTNWFEMATKPAEYINANVSLSNSGEKLKSFFLLDYYHEDAAVKTMKYDRFTVRSNNDYMVNDKLKVFSKIQGQYIEYDDQSASTYAAYTYLPWDFPYNEDGTIRTGREEDWYGRDKSNYMESQYKNFTKYQNIYFQVTAGFNWKITNYLTFESNNNANYKIARDESYVDPNTIGGQAEKGSVSNAYSWNTNYFTNQMLRFNKLFNSIHSVSALMAYEYNRQFYQNTSAVAKGITPGKEVIDGTTGMKSMGGSKNAFNIQSFLLNANYNYDSKYMAQVSFRRDGSSKFGKNNQYGNFYTFSGGWNISNEKFFEQVSNIVNELKLRASWGVIGNTPNGNYNHLSLYNPDEYNQYPSYFPSQLGNPDLTWEKNKTLDVGLDFGLYKRIRGSIDFYDKYTSDLLYFVQLSTLTGYSGQWQNIGAIRNKGVELAIDADVLKQKNWVLNLNMNISHNQNRIKELYGGRPQVNGNRRFEESRDMDELYMAEWAGVNPEDGSPQWYTTDKDGNRVLTSKYTDANNNKVYLGSAAPKFFGGFGASLSWKDLTLNLAFNYSYGNKLYSSGRELLDSDGAYTTYNSINLKKGWSRWENPGDIATHPKAFDGGNNNAHKTSSRYLEDGSYLSLRNLSLTYAVPSSFTNKIGLKNLNLSFRADNLFTITKYSLISPEVGAAGGTGTAGSSLYPLTRKFVFGINLTI